jgi:dienelactone hydrolase
MRERAVVVGRTVELAGILTEPPRPETRAGAPGLVCVNAGLLHKVGPSRLHVRLARALAAEGLATLRLDLSGIGDSDPRREPLSFEQSAVADLREAMDYLETTLGQREFVLFGLCAGSDMAFEAAKADARVIGLIQLDAYAYRNWRWYLNHYGPRVARVRCWRGYVERQTRTALGLERKTDDDNEVISPYARAFPPKEQVHADLERLAARGMRFFNIFSGGQDHYNYARQHEDTFADIDFRNRLRVDYLPDADHIFTGLEHQAYVVDAVRQWLFGFIPRRATNTAVAEAS